MRNSVEKLSRHCKQIAYYSLILLGHTSYWYDFEKGIYKSNTVSRIILLMTNIGGLTVMILTHVDYLKMIFNSPGQHPLMIIVASANFQVRAISVIYTVFHIWRFVRAFVEIKIQMQILENKCAAKFLPNQEIESRFKHLYYLKYVMLVYIYSSCLLTSSFASPRDLDIWKVIMIVSYTNVWTLSYIVQLQYFHMHAKICRLFYYIDWEVGNITEKVTTPTSDNGGHNEYRLCSDMSWLLAVHSDLCLILQHVQYVFKWQIFISRLASIGANITAIYFSFVFHEFIYKSKVLICLSSATYLLATLDMYLSDLMCDMTSHSFEDLELSLKLFNGAANTGKGFNKQCEEFSFYMCNRKLNLKVAGALNMDRKSWFCMMSSLVMYSIVLIQNHLNIDRHLEHIKYSH